MSIVKLTTNIPSHVEAKYLDVCPGKYGPQFRIKGVVDGDTDALLYLPGKFADVGNALGKAGVIGTGEIVAPSEGEKPVNVPLLVKKFTVTDVKLAGEKYGTLKVTTNGSGAPPVQQPAPRVAAFDESAWEAIEADERAAVGGIQEQAASVDRFAQLAALYDKCFNHALSHSPALTKSQVGDSPEALSARAATLFIQATQRGLA